MDVPGISRPVLVVLIVTAIGLLATGGSWVLSWVTRSTETTTRTMLAASRIDIESHRSGDIQVVGTDRADIRLTTTEHRTLFGRPHSKVTFEDGRLRVDGHCSEFELSGSDAACSITYRLEVPRDTAVALQANASDVRVEHLAGTADVRTQSGDLHASDIAGDLHATAISGDVHADSGGRVVDVSATSGDIHVHARNPMRVRANTVSGDVHVSVPDRAYAVRTHAGSGDENVDVDRDERAARTIEAGTTSGDLHVSPDG